MMLAAILFVFLATAAVVVVAALLEAWVWLAAALFANGLALVAMSLWMRRHPEFGGQRRMDIATVIGVIAAAVLVAIIAEELPDTRLDPAWIVLVGAPVCALLIGHPLHELVGLVGFVRNTIMPPSAVVERMEAEVARLRATEPSTATPPTATPPTATLPANQAPEVSRTRWELERGSHLLTRLRQYLLAAAVLSGLVGLAVGLQAEAAAWADIVARSLVPPAAGIAVATLICWPLQIKLDTYRRYLGDG